MITRDFIKQHPTWLFVFGDNLEHRGYGGQAAVARGEPNAFGVATKRAPTNHVSAFMSETDINLVQLDLDRLDSHAPLWERVVLFPGIGKGYACLQDKAPQLLAYIEDRLSCYAVVTGEED